MDTKSLSYLSFMELFSDKDKWEELLLPMFQRFQGMEYRLVLLQANAHINNEQQE